MEQLGNNIIKEVIIDGNNFNNIDEFFDEIDKVLTKDLDWKTGHNFNAFHDILKGGFGVHEYDEPILIKWINFQKSKNDFGYDATIKNYRNLLKTCHVSDKNYFKEMLKNAELHMGETLLDIIIDYINNSKKYEHNCKLEIIE
jgi:RNAse (barnase) inhibitor barstar